MDRCDARIQEALELVRHMNALADSGEVDCRDDGCILLFGVIRDCAYKIKAFAEREQKVHEAAAVYGPP